MKQPNSRNHKHAPLGKDKKLYTAPVLKPYGTLRDLVRVKGTGRPDGEVKVSKELTGSG